jgi:hypothetical protein
LRSLDQIDDFWFNRLWEGTLLHTSPDWRATVPKAAFYEEYVKHVARLGISRKRSQVDFGRRLNQLAPGLRDARPVIANENGVAERVWCYNIPALDACRAAFEDLLNQSVDWPPPPEGESSERNTTRWMTTPFPFDASASGMSGIEDRSRTQIAQ